MRQRRRIVFFCGIYLIIVLIIIGALITTIKTDAINTQNQELKNQLTRLKQTNKTLLLKVLETSSLDKIDAYATNKLSMSQPKNYHYIYIKNEQN